MASQGWILALCFSLASVFGTTESVTTAHTQKYTCRTFGSGVVQPFNGSSFYVRSNCPFTFTHFTHNRVECDITVQRGASGLLVQVEIIINKVRTILRNGSILVEKKSVSLPYDHTYQHIFRYGIYTRLRSTLLPLSVTWHNAAKGIDTLWVELDQELSADMTGLCGKHNMPANKQLLITESVLSEDTCQTRDPVAASNKVCSEFFSHTLDCLQAQTPHYIQLCGKNSYTYENSKSINCAFFKEIVWRCGNTSYVWNLWRALTQCAPPTCPGDLVYVEQGPAFVPSCSNPNPRLTSQDLTSSCICPNGKVLNDRSDGFHCVDKSSCSCVFAGQSFATGDIRSTKCQSCRCNGGKWICSGNFCPARCLIEGQFVTTFDGKRYIVPGKCTYVASQGLNWTITVEFSQKEPSLKTVVLQLFQEIYTFTQNTLKFGDQEITELHQSDHALVFWQSSMYVQVHTSFDMKIQVQMSPEIQLYITPPRNYNGVISGLCGNSNNDTTDDFTTSSGIVENSAQPFALSWSVGSCAVNIPPTCVSADNEIFADEKCAVLNNPTGIFAPCHGHIPTDEYHTACIQRTCNCGSNLLQCWCVALSSYAKACAGLGIEVGDWRKATNCTLKCQKNQEFSYDVLACNRTCLSLSGPDPRCGLEDAPVEGCGCPKETHLNVGHTCTPKAECPCHYNGGTTPPGHVVIDGRQCLCENGELHCSKDCGCMNGKVCVHCSEYPVNTAQKTCDSLSRPLGTNTTCVSGCYCPYDQYEDHHGNCVSVHNCTCMYSGKVFGAGEHVKTKCKTCVCGQGQWHCTDEPCPGTCQVYGNGHYQTFDTKWYRFDGHCQYTLVEDYCGSTNGTFSVRVESVPCCDEALTCSRSIVLDLQNKVTLTMSDMKVTKQIQNGWTVEQDLLFTTHTVGLYIIISVPSRGITLIWDKHTRITIELHQKWRNKVCGLCGNFDSNEMNDLETRGSAVLAGPLDFGNSWKAATPPCSDVTTEIFPCERNSYCSAWAQRRCMILRGDTFKDCHFKVDPEPYYQACVQESCSCEFEGKFLGFCTAVAAYAEACSDQDVCINWRTPDLCPVYCDYYNEQGQCSWHYEACGRTLTCGNYLSHKLEGCYPKCPKEVPFYDENTGECTTLKNCTCYFNDTVVPSGKVLIINSIECPCENGIISCSPPPTTAPTTIPTTSTPSTTASTTSETTYTTVTTLITTINVSTTTETWSTLPTASTPATTAITTTETWTTEPPTTSTPVSTLATTETWTTEPLTTSTQTSTLATAETWTTEPSTTVTQKGVQVINETWTTEHTTNSIPTSTLATTETWTTEHTTNSIPTSTLATTEMWTTEHTTNSTPTSTLATTEMWTTEPPTTSTPTSTLATTETWTTEHTTNSTPTSTLATTEHTTTSTPTSTLATTETWTTEHTTSSTPTSTLATTETWTTEHTTNSTPTSTLATTEHTTTSTPTSTVPPCKCTDLKKKEMRDCGDTWVEDCFYKNCTEGKIELTSLPRPEITVPTCPRDLLTYVSDGCYDIPKCNCQCELYGDPHYISFQGVTFDFLDECTYILVEERSPRHNLTIAVDNFYCISGLEGSCAKGIILKYQNNIATLSIVPDLFAVQATLNNVTIQPPYEEHGLKFETTGYKVSIYLPEIRSFVSLTPTYNLVVNLAMEHFVNNTQGQCGVCGGASCVRKGGKIEDDTCCDKTAYDWVYPDPLKPACVSAPRDVPCFSVTTPTATPSTCPPSPLCELLDHPVFESCRQHVDLSLKKKNCKFDSCQNPNGSCSSLEQAAEECKAVGFCIDWRKLTNGICDVPCRKGLVYRECQNKLDDFCYGGKRYPGSSLEKSSTGCFCPPNLIRAGKYSDVCLPDCDYCKGPDGTIKLPGEVWQSNCQLCRCNNQTLTEECSPKPPKPAPLCGPYAVLKNTSCCGDPVCVDQNCIYQGQTYRLGDKWTDPAHPCMSFSCSADGILTEARACSTESCPEEDRIWDGQTCFTCNQTCAPRVSSVNITVDNCTAVAQMPVCKGQCASHVRVVLNGDLRVQQDSRCCQERDSVEGMVTLQCSDLTSRRYAYRHITRCECRTCGIWR